MNEKVTVGFLLLLITFPSHTTTDWTSECVTRYPASCRCTWSSGKRLADCAKSNMNGLPVLSSEIQMLDMSNNKLSVLQDNAFTNANLINLQKLYLKGCRVTKIHDLALNNLRILIEIDLSNNELEFVDPVIFSTNVRLRVIKLNNNRIHTVREFPVLDFVNTIDLSQNGISNFSRNTFVGLRNLKVLDLSNNHFSNLNPDIFPPLSSLMLRGNAWVCDCELKRLRDYVIANKFIEPELRCSEPLSLFNSQWDGFEELSCKPEILHILANGKVVDSIVAVENTLVLSCVVRGEPLPDVKWVKNGRVVQDALVIVHEVDRTVMLNLTVGKHDNEFVCVGSNSGGVVERNLTVNSDETGLSVVFKEGFVERENGIIGFRGERGSLVVYLVVGVVFLSLVVGLVVGGVCVWKWGKIRGGVGEGDTVVKSVIKDENTKVTDERGDMVVMTSGIRNVGSGGGSIAGLAEQMPLLKPHTSADDLLDTDRFVNGRPTPDLLINGGASREEGEEEEDNESVYTPSKFPPDNTSIYDNYDLLYNKPLLTGPDSLRRYAFLRSNDGSKAGYASPYGTVAARPSSVCSEPRGGPSRESPGVAVFSRDNDTVILPHGYVTLPRRSIRDRGNKPTNNTGGVIKYDNLGPRSTADGCSNFSLNKCGVDTSGVATPQPQTPQQQQQQQPPLPPDPLAYQPHYSNLQQLQEDLYDQLNAVGCSPSPQHHVPDYLDYSTLKHPQFDPIPEDPGDGEQEEEEGKEEKKKYRPVPPPKPKKKPPVPVDPPPEPPTLPPSEEQDDGTEV